MTGGIGAGKSTVSSTFSELGGIVVDGDVIAREVVEPGTEGLAELVEAFGDGHPAARRCAEPAGAGGDRLQRRREAQHAERHRASTGGASALGADRRGGRRCRDRRGHPAAGRIADGADVPAGGRSSTPTTRCACSGSSSTADSARTMPGRGSPRRPPRSSAARSPMCGWTTPAAQANWSNRPARCGTTASCRSRTTSTRADRRMREPRLVPSDPTWPDQARRIVARLQTACGHRASRIDHIGSTAVPGLDAKDVIDMQVTVASLEVADELAEALLAAGYPRRSDASHRRRRSHRRSVVVAQAVSLLGRSRPTHQRAYPGRRLAQSAVRPVVRRLADGRPRSARRSIWRSSAPRGPRPTTPRPRSRGSSMPTAGPGSGRTPRAGGRSRSGGGSGLDAGCGGRLGRRRCRRVHRTALAGSPQTGAPQVQHAVVAGRPSARSSRGAMNWSACATIWSSTRISQCRFAEYGHWIDTCIAGRSGTSDSTVFASKVRPGTIVGFAVAAGRSAL